MISSGYGISLKRRLFMFGDSITDGSLSIPDPITKYGYAYNIAARKGWETVDLAVGGTRIFDSTQTAPMSGQNTTSNDRIVWLTGYNDMRFSGNDSTYINNFGTALSAQLTILSTYGCPIILVTGLKMQAAAYSMYSPYNLGSDAAVAAYTTKVNTIAASFPLVTVVDIAAFNPSTAGNMQGDLVHPSRVGADSIASIVMSSIGSL